MTVMMRISLRLARARALRRSALPMAVLAAVLVVSATTLESLRLSPEQLAARDFGSALAKAELPTSLLAPDDSAATVARIGRAAGPTAEVALYNLEFPVLVRGAGMTASYLEAPGVSARFPGRYELVSGRWPARAGEVAISVVSRGSDIDLEAGRLEVLRQRRLLVVGRFRDRYATDNRAVVAAPGTWDRLKGVRRMKLQAVPLVWWDRAPTVAEVRRVAEVVAAPSGGEEAGAAPLGGSPLTADGRAQFMARQNLSYLRMFPAAFLAPLLLLTACAVGVIFVFNERWLRRNVALLSAVGVLPAQARAGAGLAAAAYAVLAALGGALAGLPVGLALRWVYGPWQPQPLGELAAPWVPVTQVVLVTVVWALVAGVAVVGTRALPRRRQFTTEAGRFGRLLRRVAAVATAARAGGYAVTATSGGDLGWCAALTAVTIVLLLPDIIRLAATVQTGGGPSRRLAARQLAVRPARATVAAGAILLAVAGCASLITSLSAARSAILRQETRMAGPDRIKVRGEDDGSRPPARLVAAVREITGAPLAIVYRDVQSPSLGFSHEPEGTGQPGAVDSVAQASALLDAPLTRRQRRVLLAGGALVPPSMPGERLRLVRERYDERGLPTGERRVVEIPAAAAGAMDRPWIPSGSLMLTATARRLGVSPGVQSVEFTGASAAQVERAARLTSALGYPDRVVVVAEPPNLALPAAATAALLVVLALCFVTVAGVARSQAVTLQRELGLLVAVGVGPAWARGVLYRQVALSTAVGLLAGLPVALVPLAVVRFRTPLIDLHVPWVALALLTAAAVTASFAAAALASRRLTAVVPSARS